MKDEGDRMRNEYLAKENQNLKAQISELLVFRNSLTKENLCSELELENERLKLRLKMQENRLEIIKNIYPANFTGFLENVTNEEGHFCYCGGRALDGIKENIKESLLEKFNADKDGELIEKLFSLNEQNDLNKKFWKLKEKYLVSKMEELKQINHDSENKKVPEENQNNQINSIEIPETSNIQIDRNILRLISLSKQNLSGDIQSGTENASGDDALVDKDLVIEQLQEDVANLISVSEKRKINRSTMQTQFLKSDLFRKVVEVNKKHINYIEELENRIDQFAKIVVEIEYTRKKELDDLAYREKEGTNYLSLNKKKKENCAGPLKN